MVVLRRENIKGLKSNCQYTCCMISDILNKFYVHSEGIDISSRSLLYLVLFVFLLHFHLKIIFTFIFWCRCLTSQWISHLCTLFSNTKGCDVSLHPNSIFTRLTRPSSSALVSTDLESGHRFLWRVILGQEVCPPGLRYDEVDAVCLEDIWTKNSFFHFTRFFF